MSETALDLFPEFKSEESKARYMAAYDAALSEWPVPYEDLDVPTRIGVTHVIAASAFSKAQLRAIQAPTLLLIGDKERLYEPHAILKLAQERLPGLTGAIVPNADHIAAMAQPDDVNERIIQFLQRGE
ncbi:MAG: alpha/beta fold hydrolase [Steroidobacteraceae bacterium]